MESKSLSSGMWEVPEFPLSALTGIATTSSSKRPREEELEPGGGGGGRRRRAAAAASPSPPALPFSFDILKRIVELGPRHPSYVWSNGRVHVMRDAFPKATHHFLVLPVDTSISNLDGLWSRVLQEKEHTQHPCPINSTMCTTAVSSPSPPHLQQSVRDNDDFMNGGVSSSLPPTPPLSPAAAPAADVTYVQIHTSEVTTPACCHTSPPQHAEPPTLSLLQEMIFVGHELVRQLCNSVASSTATLRQSLPFRLGFHAAPSLKHLHMHVISSDFERSDALKTKTHYLSFTTDFFVDAEEVLKHASAVTLNSSEATSFFASLKQRSASVASTQPIRCHWCRLTVPNMPKLKQHLLHDCTSCPHR